MPRDPAPQAPWLLARFAQPEQLEHAARALTEQGYRGMEAHSPFPLPEVQKLLGKGRSRVPLICLLGGLSGVATGALLQWFCNVYDFNINIGGRPSFSLPTYVPICFEVGVLFASFSALFAAIILGGLPRPYHGFFRSHAFLRASTDSFVLSVQAPDEGPLAWRRLAGQLQDLGAAEIDQLESLQ